MFAMALRRLGTPLHGGGGDPGNAAREMRESVKDPEQAYEIASKSTFTGVKNRCKMKARTRAARARVAQSLGDAGRRSAIEKARGSGRGQRRGRRSAERHRDRAIVGPP